MFATAVPGLAQLLSDELGSSGARVTQLGFDGRADVVLFEAESADVRTMLDLRLAEDVFAEIGRTLRSEGDRPNWITTRIWRPERIRRALAARAALVRATGKRATYRVIVRVRQERSFLRTDLRREFDRAVARDQPGWRRADPAELELWVVEYQQGKLVAGVRISDAEMRQHHGRVEERSGALRPTVAAAMVLLAGQPDGVLLDPCCGSGTILTEALAAGWTAYGRDIDPAAVRIAGRNAGAAELELGDARRLDLPDESVAACVSNLPFGTQYEVPEPMDVWLREVLAELARVTRPGGRLVLLAPDIPRAVVPAGVRLTGRHQLRLFGHRSTMWIYQR